jgi:uncharacterized protein (TIGR03435 family)
VEGDVRGANWQDPRLSNPLASRLITCRNVPIARFVLALNRLNVGVEGPVVDATKIAGRYDFAVNFSPGVWFHIAGSRKASAGQVGAGLNRLIPISEALRTQLGLDLRPRQVFEAVLVVDHVEDNPTS